MRGTLVASATTIAVALGVALSPIAAANPTFYPSGYKGDGNYVAYMNDLMRYGVDADLPTSGALGSTICTKLRDGVSQLSVISSAANAPGTTRMQADVAVYGAEWHFCPEYY